MLEGKGQGTFRTSNKGMGSLKEIVLGIEGGFDMLIKKNDFH